MSAPSSPKDLSEIQRELGVIAERQAWHRVFEQELLADIHEMIDEAERPVDERLFSALDIGRLMRLAERRCAARRSALVAALGFAAEEGP